MKANFHSYLQLKEDSKSLKPNISKLTQIHQGENFYNTGNIWGFPGGALVKNLPANAGEAGSSPGLGWSHMRSN